MINIIELRVGNYCHAFKKVQKMNAEGEPVQPTALDKIKAAYRENNLVVIYQVISINNNEEIGLLNPLNNEIQKYNVEEVYPIELNLELLKKLGFSKKTLNSEDLFQNFLTTEGVVSLRITEQASLYMFDKQTKANTFLRHVNSLHQLQNIFVDLADKKIEITFT